MGSLPVPLSCRCVCRSVCALLRAAVVSCRLCCSVCAACAQCVGCVWACMSFLRGRCEGCVANCQAHNRRLTGRSGTAEWLAVLPSALGRAGVQGGVLIDGAAYIACVAAVLHTAAQLAQPQPLPRTVLSHIHLPVIATFIYRSDIPDHYISTALPINRQLQCPRRHCTHTNS